LPGQWPPQTRPRAYEGLNPSNRSAPRLLRLISKLVCYSRGSESRQPPFVVDRIAIANCPLVLIFGTILAALASILDSAPCQLFSVSKHADLIQIKWFNRAAVLSAARVALPSSSARQPASRLVNASRPASVNVAIIHQSADWCSLRNLPRSS